MRYTNRRMLYFTLLYTLLHRPDTTAVGQRLSTIIDDAEQVAFTGVLHHDHRVITVSHRTTASSSSSRRCRRRQAASQRRSGRRRHSRSWSAPRRVPGAEQLARQSTCRSGQHPHDVGMLEMDDVALGAETLHRGQGVLDGAMKALDGHRAIAVDAQVDRAETARTDLSLQPHLPVTNY